MLTDLEKQKQLNEAINEVVSGGKNPIQQIAATIESVDKNWHPRQKFSDYGISYSYFYIKNTDDTYSYAVKAENDEIRYGIMKQSEMNSAGKNYTGNKSDKTEKNYMKVVTFLLKKPKLTK